MRTKSCVLIIIVAILLAFSSCSLGIRSSSQNMAEHNSSNLESESNRDESKSSEHSTLTENNGVYLKRKINNNLYIDATVDKGYKGQHTFYTYSAKPFEFDPDKTQSILLKNANIIKKASYSEAKTYKTSSGSMLSIMQMGNLNYTTTHFFNTYYSIFHRQSDKWKNDNKYPRFTDLKFESYQAAINKANDLLKELGMDNEQLTVIYSLDYKTMQEQQKILDEHGRFQNPRTGKKDPLKTDWSEKDDCYMMVFSTTIDGFPISTYSHGSVDDDSFVGGSDLEMYWSNYGVESLNIQYNYSVIKKENKVNIISLDSAIKKIENKYDQIILNNPVTVTKIALMYLPIVANKKTNKFTLVPTWIFDISQVANTPGSKNEERITNVFINAVSGEEIL